MCSFPGRKAECPKQEDATEDAEEELTRQSMDHKPHAGRDFSRPPGFEGPRGIALGFR